MYSEEMGLHRLLAPAVESLGYELLGVERLQGKAGTLLRVYIDSNAGITVDDCGRVSHQISGILDVEDPIKGHYTLEVSSPGLDRPLFTKAHFERFIGADVKMEISQPVDGRRRLACQLVDVRGDDIVILNNGQEYFIPLNGIVKARLVPKYRGHAR